MSFPRYENYKDSGVEWLGEVPAHWKIKTIRGLAREGRNTFIDGDWIESPFITDEGVRLIQTGNVGIGEYKEQGFRYISEQTFHSLNCTEVEPNNILICRLADPVGRACLAPNLGMKMITSVDVCILKTSNEICASYLVYLFSSAQYLGFMEGQCRGGTRDRVSRSFLGSVRIAIPEDSEQQTIAAFLDRETAKIDALIAEQQRLIELLKEKRQAVISHAVTKGLNPDAPMKDSGIEWLGEVPAHWGVSPFKYHVSIRSGGTPSKQNLDYWDGEIPWASAKDLKSDEISDTIDHITQLAIESGQANLIPAGSILVVVRGMILAKTFPVTVNKVAMAINQDLKAIEPKKEINDNFLVWLLRGTAKESMNRTDEAGHGTKALRMDAWTSMHITIPPFDEQSSISMFLDKETTKLDTLTTEAKRGIELLQERRTALISAAVTGKIDVRGLVSTAIPEEAAA